MAKKKTEFAPESLAPLSQDTDPRNRNLNAAFMPKWQARPELASVNPGASGDTQFDPFLGSQWGDWLDAIGAKTAGGARLAGPSLFGKSPAPAGQAQTPPSIQAILGPALDMGESEVLKRGKAANSRAKSYLESVG